MIVVVVVVVAVDAPFRVPGASDSRVRRVFFLRALTMTDSESLSLATPDTFPAFPYALPYKIQLDLMQHLYNSIEHKKITIVESPTGTVRPTFAHSLDHNA